MARLIEADALVDAIKNRIEEDREIYPDFSRFYLVGMRIVINIIKVQDTVDAVKHGHWQESQSLDDCFWICSCCRFPSQASAAPQLYNYCPFCGAKMDGDKNAID